MSENIKYYGKGREVLFDFGCLSVPELYQKAGLMEHAGLNALYAFVNPTKYSTLSESMIQTIETVLAQAKANSFEREKHPANIYVKPDPLFIEKTGMSEEALKRWFLYQVKNQIATKQQGSVLYEVVSLDEMMKYDYFYDFIEFLSQSVGWHSKSVFWMKATYYRVARDVVANANKEAAIKDGRDAL